MEGISGDLRFWLWRLNGLKIIFSFDFIRHDDILRRFSEP